MTSPFVKTAFGSFLSKWRLEQIKKSLGANNSVNTILRGRRLHAFVFHKDNHMNMKFKYPLHTLD
jgi:hypothetical protein